MQGFPADFALLVGYFLGCALLALLMRRFLTLPGEVYRKMLHFILVASIFVFLYGFDSWYEACLAATIFAVAAYPALSFAERFESYAALLAERKGGEIKRSLIAAFTMFAAIIAICWGLFGARYLALAVILGWGLGDAAAALVGKKYGRHHLKGKFIDGQKSLEGTAAMLVVSFLAIGAVLLLNGDLPRQYLPAIASVAALVCAVVELHTKNGMDTLTCPASTLAVLLLLLRIWGG